MDNPSGELAALAKQLSGNTQTYVPDEQPQEPETPEETTDEVVAEGAEVTESETTPEGDEVDEAVEASTEEIPSSVKELAEAIGWESSDIYDLKIPMGGDGHTITIGEFKDKVEGLETATTQLEQKRSELTEREAQINQQMAEAPEELINARAQAVALSMQYQGINWAEIEQSDPGRAALMKQNLSSQFQAAKDQEAQAMSQVQAKIDEGKRTLLAEQGKVLLEHIPEWGDTTLRDKEQQAIVEWGASQGLSRDGLLQLTDASIVTFLHNMWKRDQQVTESDVEVKRVRKAPKMLKPGSTQVKGKSSKKTASSIIQQSKQPNLKRKERDNLAVALLRNAGVK